MPTAHRLPVALAALSAQIELSDGAAPAAIQLLPAGTFRAEDGRPTDAPAWTLDAASAQTLIDQIAARTNRVVIDYEHQTVHAKANGQPAPAAGWFKALEWREGSGLWAVGVQWTDRARQMIAAGEYRFISPVFTYDRKTGAITRILHAALTNDPALDGMAAVAAASSQLASQLASTSETPAMDELIERLVYLLNLPVTSTPQEIAAQLDKIKAAVLADAPGDAAAAAKFGGLDAYIAALKAKADTAQAALTAEREATAALKASTQPMEVVAALRSELATLTAEVNARKIDDLVSPALADGRLLPTQEAWARDLGASNLAALSAYLQTAQPIAALTKTQTGGNPPIAVSKADDADGIAQAALAYQAEQARSGVQISTQAAVAHIVKAQGKSA